MEVISSPIVFLAGFGMGLSLMIYLVKSKRSRIILSLLLYLVFCIAFFVTNDIATQSSRKDRDYYTSLAVMSTVWPFLAPLAIVGAN